MLKFLFMTICFISPTIKFYLRPEISEPWAGRDILERSKSGLELDPIGM